MIKTARSHARRLALMKIASGPVDYWARFKNVLRPRWNGFKENTSNTVDALLAGQVPIPWVTVGDKYENKPFGVKPGEPVYIGMAGADPGRDSDFSDNFRSQSGMYFPPGPAKGNNVQMFRWFDRAAARRAIIDAARKGHPVYAFGESYGGRAIADVVRDSGETVQGVTMYDPVSWRDFSAPTNTRTKATSIYPNYDVFGHSGNIVATIGGRHPEVPNADTVHDGVSHFASFSWVNRNLQAKERARKQQLAEQYAKEHPELLPHGMPLLNNEIVKSVYGH